MTNREKIETIIKTYNRTLSVNATYDKCKDLFTRIVEVDRQVTKVVDRSKLEVITLDELIEIISSVTNVSIEDIKGSRRYTEAVLSRSLLYYFGKFIYGYTFVKLGKFTNRDHSTVIHNYRNFDNDIKQNRLFKAWHDEVFNKIVNLSNREIVNFEL
jgi:chromosomal replication initiation ATPase DnaA